MKLVVSFNTVENTSGVAQGIDTSQYWDVKLSNLSTSTIPNVWLALEKAQAVVILLLQVLLI